MPRIATAGAWVIAVVFVRVTVLAQGSVSKKDDSSSELEGPRVSAAMGVSSPLAPILATALTYKSGAFGLGARGAAARSDFSARK